MSSASLSQSGGAHQYYCYQCDSHVTIVPPSSPTVDDLVCPGCQGSFLEESDSPPPVNPNPSVPAAVAPRSSALSASPIPLSSFLNNFINNPQARGANIQFVFESQQGADFRLGDYFVVGPGLEQLIQQLADNDPNRHGTPPASKSAVDGLPDIKITQELLDSDSSQCAVCKDCFDLKEEEAKQMPCKHIYHKDCILPWLEMHNSCPVCRFELPTDDPEYENRATGRINDNNNIINNNNNHNDNGALNSSGAGVEDLD